MNRTRRLNATVKAVGEGDDPAGSFEAILSMPTIDRDGEIIDPKAFDPLPERIPVDIDHGLSVPTTVGSGTPFYDGDTLKIKGTFSSIPRGQEVRTLIAEGHINAMSVAFMDSTREKDADGIPHVTKAELLNATFAPLPSNRGALVLSVKAGARNSASDQSMIQTIHDTSAELGADCGSAKSQRGPRIEAKAIVGSYEERQDDLTDAIVDANTGELARLYPDVGPGEYEWYVSIIATFDDRVVYRLGWGDDNEYQATYTIDDAGVITLADVQPVEVDQVISPADPDATDAKGASADDEDMELRARALQLAAASVA